MDEARSVRAQLPRLSEHHAVRGATTTHKHVQASQEHDCGHPQNSYTRFQILYST
jgi:hypothetical protein